MTGEDSIAPSGVAHVVLTRFNVPTPGFESVVRAKEGWLRSRVALFERYCLPSMRRQVGARAEWIIYFDPQSPDWLRQWIDDVNDGVFTPVFRSSVSYEERMADIRRVAGRAPGRMLITTNLDNDDALASDFLDRVQRAVVPGVRTAIYLADGLIAEAKRLYHRVDRDNAFCSVAEPWDAPGDPPVTCWLRPHNRLGETMAVRSLRGEPGWLQVVHGENVSNRVRGRLVSPKAFRGRFDPMLAAFPEPGLGRLARDRFVSGPLRTGREVARGAAKRLAVALYGPDAIDTVKLRAARLRPGRSRR
ncbi:glycosyltransferase [Microbacterium yannicii]|uniref:glycosyltransferase n=1 Tax=Microbacterium yannicii TaxID=671622 RepID=UPI0002F78DF3|nr:glycosyltransferase [Microbacterium yannicii]